MKLDWVTAFIIACTAFGAGSMFGGAKAVRGMEKLKEAETA